MARERDALRRAVTRAGVHLTTNEERLLLRLFQFCRQGTDGRVPHEAPTPRLAAELGIGVSTLERARRRLIRLGLIDVEGGTGRRSYAYRVILPAGLPEQLNDARRYPRRPPHLFHKVKGEGLHLPSRSKEPGARSDPPGDQLHPSPTPSARESCGKHPRGPKNGCRACGTSPRQRGTNPRSRRTNPKAGYRTPIPPRHIRTPVGVPPPPGVLDDVRAALATLKNRRTA